MGTGSALCPGLDGITAGNKTVSVRQALEGFGADIWTGGRNGDRD